MRSAILICTRSRAHSLFKLILSLQNQEEIANICRVLIIDSSIGEETQSIFTDEISKLQLPVSYHRVSPEYTLPRKRNFGLNLLNFSEIEILHFFDDDVQLNTDYLGSVNAIFKDSSVVGVGGADQNLKKRHIHKILELAGISSKREGAILRSGVNTQNISGTIPRESEWLSGCAMSYATSALKGNLFDERRHFDGEDTDFSYRMSKKGKLIWNPNAKFYHESSRAKKLTSNHKIRYHLRHLVLSCTEFDGKVKPGYSFIYLFFNGLISIAISLKRFKILEVRIGISYILYSLIFPFSLARHCILREVQSINFKRTTSKIDTHKNE